jgi:hypothetical protein
MTLTDNPFVGVVTPRGRRPRVSVVIVEDERGAAPAIEHLPDFADEVILVRGAAVRAAFAAAGGECIVMMNGGCDADAGRVKGFVAALQSGVASARAAALQGA